MSRRIVVTLLAIALAIAILGVVIMGPPPLPPFPPIPPPDPE